MDTLPRLTGRQRRRSLKFGLPKAVRWFVAAVVGSFLAGLLLGWSSSAHAIGNVPTATLPQTQYSYNYGDQRSPYAVHSGQAFSISAACDAARNARDADGTYVSSNGFDTYVRQSTNTSNSEDSSSWTCATSEKNTHTFTGGNCCGGPAPTTAPNSFGGNKAVVQVPNQCPSGTSIVGGQCQCNLGTRPDSAGTACAAYQCPVQAIGEFNTSQPATGPNGAPVDFGKPAYLCDSINVGVRIPTYGCSITMSLVMQSQSQGSNTVLNWWATAYGGKPCNGGGNGTAAAPVPGTPASGVSVSLGDLPPNPASTCSKGTCPGVVNGANVCLACSNTTGTGTQSSSAASGAAATAGPAVSLSTSCNGGSCITTTTTTSPDGSSSTSTGQSTLREYCSKSPGDPQCVAAGLGLPTSVAGGASGAGAGAGSGGGGDGSSAGFGGSCQAGWTCTGDSDAVTCAIATEQHRRDCQFALNFGDATSTSLDQKGAAMYAAGDLGDADHPRRVGNVSSSGIGTFDQTNLLGGSCPADRTIATVRGSAVVLPLSKLCNPAQLLGQVLLGFTALACIFIVLGPGRSS